MSDYNEEHYHQPAGEAEAAEGEWFANNHFGFGILDKNNQPVWSEMCVCADWQSLMDEVDRLTDDEPNRAPFRIVKLSFSELGVEAPTVDQKVRHISREKARSALKLAGWCEEPQGLDDVWYEVTNPNFVYSLEQALEIEHGWKVQP